MGFDIESEYQRLKKYLDINVKDGKDGIPFECGCACGYATEIRIVPWHLEKNDYRPCEWVRDHIEVYGNAGVDYMASNPSPRLLFTITEEDVEKAYSRRDYRYNRQFGILEYYERW